MALLPNIRIDIASSFDGKGFKAASRSSNLLTKQFKTLGSTVAAALSARAIVRFSAESVKAFAEEDAAVTRLNKTFENLGLRYDGLAANDFINKLQSQVAVTDDELRPAMESLIRTTLDYGKAQDILNTALDISAGTGYDLQTVTSALSKAYQGQTTALARLNIGIGKTEAKTISFDDAIARLNDRFRGQAAAAVDTYAGKFKLLSIAADEAKEATGERMLMALELLAKDQTIQGLTDGMQSFADKIGLASIGLADLLGKMNRKIQIGGRTLGQIIFAAAGGGFIDALAKRGGVIEQSLKTRTLGAPGAVQRQKADLQRLNEEKAAQAKLLAMEKARTAEAAKQKRLKQITKMLTEKEAKFDLQRIQLAAAAQGKLTEEEKKRVAELQLIEEIKAAVAADDLTRAEDLLKRLNTLQTATFELSESLMDLKAGDPFSEWDGYFANAQKLISNLTASLNNQQMLLNSMLQSIASSQAAANTAVLAAKTDKATAYLGAAANSREAAATATKDANQALKDAADAMANAKTAQDLMAAEEAMRAAQAFEDAAKTLTESVAAADLAAALAELGLANEYLNQSMSAAKDVGIVPTVNITVNGAIDPSSTARQIIDLMNQEATIAGSIDRWGVSNMVA